MDRQKQLERLAPILERAREVASDSHFWRAYYAAGVVLRSALGEQWFETNLCAPGPLGDFFRVAARLETADKERGVRRAVQFADGLLNLPPVPGFPAWVQRARKERVEALHAEIETAKLLHIQGIPFRFQVPTGETGGDYDFGLFVSGQHVCGEAKCRVDGAAINGGAILDLLKRGREQLPPNQPGILFLKLPQDVIETSLDGMPIADWLGDRLLRNTKRVVGVVVWSEVAQEVDSFTATAIVVRELLNSNHRFDAGVNFALFPDGASPPRPWLSLWALTASAV